MKMPLGITIELEAKILLVNNPQRDILAFAELWIYECEKPEPIFKNKGFTIRIKTFGGKETICLVFPAFPSSKSKSGFQTSFIIENKSLFEDVRKLILDAYYEETGTVPEPELNKEETGQINLDDLPF